MKYLLNQKFFVAILLLWLNAFLGLKVELINEPYYGPT